MEKSILKEKTINTVLISLFIFVPMWAVFLVNHFLLGDLLNQFGIHPRQFDWGTFTIFTSWLLHMNMNHIVGNTSVLFPLLIMVCILEKNIYKTLFILITISGIFTWLLGSPNSNHIGASGLVFALFGFIISALVFGKNFAYLIPVVIVGYLYSQSILNGLIPQGDISFAAHFGGFIGGGLAGYFIHKKEKNTPTLYKKSLKDKYNDFLLDIKYKFKK